MAQKRMFDKTITNADDFLEMPDSSQNLYFHLSMNADDDGFVNNWKSIMRMTGHKEDDLKVLAAKQFIIPFDSGVIVIRHWRINNYLRNDRYKETKFKDEKSQLILGENEEYLLKNNVGIPVVATDKNRIDKNRLDKNIYTTTTLYDFLQENGFNLSPLQCEVVDTWEDNELTRYAIKQAVLNNKFNIKYVDKILYQYQKENIKTVQEALEREEEFNNKKKNYYDKKYKNKSDREERIEEWLKDEQE